MTTEPGPDRQTLIDDFERVLPGHRDLAEDLLGRYSEAHRHYHNVAHLAAVLDWIERLKVDSHDLYVIKLAAWFHDAVYPDPGGPPPQISNEEASARLSVRQLGARGLEQEDLNEVARLVRLTENHRPGQSDRHGELLCDADLAVLAAAEPDYAAYRRAVRAEYSAVPDDQFAAGRLAVLRRFGGRKIYRTTAGHRLEDDAQRNLRAEAIELINDYQLSVDGWPLEDDR